MAYRTKTYIAGDWDEDSNLIEKLEEWNNSRRLNLHYLPAHDLCSARDSSLNCNIKKSLRERLDASKTFVLIVGAHTATVTAGSCKHCASYSGYTHSCRKGYGADTRGYIEYECDYAANHDMRIVVLYNYASVCKDKCPASVQNLGKHLPAYYYGNDGKAYWDYNSIKSAIEG